LNCASGADEELIAESKGVQTIPMSNAVVSSSPEAGQAEEHRQRDERPRTP
jgi:hypothetical protein